jgi:hypothetical protein
LKTALSKENEVQH